MDTSVAWINDYLDRPADADEQAELLTHAGFPLEGREEALDDIRQDFEMTSNRGDCTCHVGLAREIAAVSGRDLILPSGTPEASGNEVTNFASLENEEPAHCPLYTGRVITGITIRPSQEHIANRLLARGDTPRSNVVDATNFVLFESGQPTHVFDLDTLEGNQIIVRMARAGERFLPIGEDAVEIELDGSELVIADAIKPVALAGVKGGALTAVTETTTNILVEAATFDPVSVRHTSRLHNISSDSSFRFERGVPPGQVDACAERLCSLILETAGGTLAPGVLRAGADLPEQIVVTMRTQRCRDILGLDIGDEAQLAMLDRLGFGPTLDKGVVTVTVPIHRGDVHREIDLIEEVMRMHGFADAPIHDAFTIRVAEENWEHRATEEITAALVGDGFIETVTHTLVTEEAAGAFLEGAGMLTLVESPAGGEYVLRPSVLSSLLHVRRHNAHQGVESLRLAELGSVFHRPDGGGDHIETLELALLMDVESDEDGIRPLRGVIDHLMDRIAGPDARVEVHAADGPSWLAPAGRLLVDGREFGSVGRIAPGVAAAFGLDDRTMFAAAIHPSELFEGEAPEREAHRLPDYPAIERDLSAIVAEEVPWSRIESLVAGLDLADLEAIEYVTAFRGGTIDAGAKSITLRLRFRGTDRTLTREEVEPSMRHAVEALTEGVAAEIRT